MNSSSSEDEDGHRNVKCAKRHGGWEGEEMELEHTKQQQQQLSSKQQTTSSYSIVDLNQFRNEEVGKGYQAKHVIRQKHVANDTITNEIKHNSCTTGRNIDDDNYHHDDDDDSKSKKKQQKRMKKEHDKKSEKKKKKKENLLLQRYLHCDGMRKFRKEIESIITS